MTAIPLSLLAAAAVAAAPAYAHAPSARRGHLGHSRSAGSGGFGAQGAVYTETNAAAGNALVVFGRDANGRLSPSHSYPTGGDGSGAGLGSGHSVIASRSGRTVLAVNAGSNSVSAFAAGVGGLRQIGEAAPSGGTTPTSVTISGRLAYVMNAGSGTISGFYLSNRWGLIPIAGSTQSLAESGTTVDSQIQFSRDGSTLIVDERGTSSLIQTFTIGAGGVATPAATVTADAGAPFGFDVDAAGHVLFSNAAFGTSSGASSYDVSDTGALTPNGGPVSSGQAAACWLAAVGGFAYTDNAGSGSIGRFSVSSRGALALTGTTSISPTSHPLDMAGADGRFLYVLANGSNEILGYRVLPGGKLMRVSAVSAPAGAAGLGAS